MDRYEKRLGMAVPRRSRKKKQHKSNTFWMLAATLTVIAWVAAFVWNATL